MDKLTVKQRKFIDAYIETLNATESARRAGYKGEYNTLGVVGHENLNKPKIKRAINSRIDELMDKSGEKVRRKLSQVKNDNHQRQNRKSQYVYVIKEEHGAYKIGMAANVAQRLQALSTAVPYKLELIMIMESSNASDLERSLHKRFSDKRISGEWFNLSHADIEYINAEFNE